MKLGSLGTRLALLRCAAKSDARYPDQLPIELAMGKVPARRPDKAKEGARGGKATRGPYKRYLSDPTVPVPRSTRYRWQKRKKVEAIAESIKPASR